MKTRLIIALVFTLFLCNCATPKPMYETAEGKKKLQHYNKLQFGQKRTNY